MGAFIDETGKQYGSWTVLYLDKENKKPDKKLEDLIPETSQFLIKGGDALCTTLK